VGGGEVIYSRETATVRGEEKEEDWEQSNSGEAREQLKILNAFIHKKRE